MTKYNVCDETDMMITPNILASKLAQDYYAIDIVKDLIQEENTIHPKLVEQIKLLNHPSIHTTSHARAHIPYFTRKMCKISHSILDGLKDNNDFEIEKLKKKIGTVLSSSKNITDIRIGSKAWKQGQYLLQLKIDLGEEIISRSICLSPEWGDLIYLHRRHPDSMTPGVHFIVPIMDDIRDTIKTTRTMIMQIWLGTPDHPEVVAGTMYASDTYPDEPSEKEKTAGILFKNYFSEADREKDALLFIEGIKTGIPALMEPTEYQMMVLHKDLF